MAGEGLAGDIFISRRCTVLRGSTRPNPKTRHIGLTNKKFFIGCVGCRKIIVKYDSMVILITEDVVAVCTKIRLGPYKDFVVF